MPIPGIALAAGIVGSPGAVVNIDDALVQDAVFTPSESSAVYILRNDGTIETQTATGGPSIIGSWILPNAAAGNAYEGRATVISGSLSAGTTGVWLGLGTSRPWTRNQVGVGQSICEFTLEIRLASNGAVLATATITLDAQVVS